MRRTYQGPSYNSLSEPLQNELIAYLYTLGVRPEVGLAVEYLSWNKEQRLYMDWLKRMYFNVVPKQLQEGDLSKSIEGKDR